MAEPSIEQRRFTGRRKVRLGDVTSAGRLRLDALTRYTQDVSDDDTTDAGLDVEPGWVVRRTVVTEHRSARLGETIDVTTFCSGLGRRWAERHLEIVGDQGACYDVVTLWICVDATTGRPMALSDQFLEIYGPSAAGRSVTARLVNPKLETAAEASLDRRSWPLRVADFDTLGHVNNAAYWAAVEEVLADGWASIQPPLVATMEYSAGLAPTEEVTIVSVSGDSAAQAWWLTNGGVAAASVVVQQR